MPHGPAMPEHDTSSVSTLNPPPFTRSSGPAGDFPKALMWQGTWWDTDIGLSGDCVLQLPIIPNSER